MRQAKPVGSCAVGSLSIALDFAGAPFALRLGSRSDTQGEATVARSMMTLAVLLLAAPAVAQSDQNARWCRGENGASLEQTISGCTAVIERKSDTPRQIALAYSLRGGALYYKGDPVRAIGDYDQAIALDPTFARAFNNRCWARAVVGRVQEAIADCDESLRLAPDVANTLENRGFAHLKMGQYDRAIADYDAGLRLDPPNKADFLYGRGLAKLKKGDTSGSADVAAAKALHETIADEFASYGVR
jgi:tetratricopeptide (TPR) repeat protein